MKLCAILFAYDLVLFKSAGVLQAYLEEILKFDSTKQRCVNLMTAIKNMSDSYFTPKSYIWYYLPYLIFSIF